MEETPASVLAEKNPHKKQISMLYVGGVRRKTYFRSYENYRGCGLIGHTKTFGEFGPWRYRLGSSTGVDFKIQGRHQKTLHQLWNFCQLAGQSEPPLCNLPWIYVWPPNIYQQAAGRAPSKRRVKLETPFRKMCSEGHGNQSHQCMPGWTDSCQIKGGNWKCRPRGSIYLGC